MTTKKETNKVVAKGGGKLFSKRALTELKVKQDEWEAGVRALTYF